MALSQDKEEQYNVLLEIPDLLPLGPMAFAAPLGKEVEGGEKVEHYPEFCFFDDFHLLQPINTPQTS